MSDQERKPILAGRERVSECALRATNAGLRPSAISRSPTHDQLPGKFIDDLIAESEGCGSWPTWKNAHHRGPSLSVMKMTSSSVAGWDW